MKDKTIIVDIDGTICKTYQCKDGSWDYEGSVPILPNIAKVNELYDEGYHIVYLTARGARSGIDWTDLTREQLERWGCRFHELKLGKPHYDLMICDKVINARDWEVLGNEQIKSMIGEQESFIDRNLKALEDAERKRQIRRENQRVKKTQYILF
jgi:dTDP-glucose 4,6-dehydratase